MREKQTIRHDECLLYAGELTDSGYGRVRYRLCGKEKNAVVHRLMYEKYKGDIPEGLVTDHLCRVRSCINPDHLEPVPQIVNDLRGLSPWAVNARKTHCKRGHEFNKKNTKLVKKGRACIQCAKQYERKKSHLSSERIKVSTQK